MTCFRINGMTLSRYCKENGISYSRAYHWLDKKGSTVEEAIKQSQNKMRPNVKWGYNGESIYSLCKTRNINYCNALNKIRQGNDVQWVLDEMVKNKGKKGIWAKHTYNGESFKDYCKKTGINYHSAFYWIRKGMDIKQVVERMQNV